MRTRGKLLTGAIVSAAVTTLATVLAPLAFADTYHPASLLEMEANEAKFIATGQDPAQSAPGVNLDGCTPSAAHPNPVVLVHGLNGNQYNGWAYVGPVLANLGYCVYSLNYGGTNAWNGGTEPIATSAPQIASFVDSVLARTGASQVDLVGHSEGGFQVEYLISSHDEAVTPYRTAAIGEPCTHDLVVQDVCPDDPVGHVGLAYDNGVVTMLTNALDPAHPTPVACAVGSPY